MLKLEFDSHEVKYYDVKPYLNFGIFTELNDITYFNTVATCLDSIAWKNGQDFSPETLYIKGDSELKN